MSRHRIVALTDEGVVARVIEDHLEVPPLMQSELHARALTIFDALGQLEWVAIEWWHESHDQWERTWSKMTKEVAQRVIAAGAANAAKAAEARAKRKKRK